MTSPDAENQSLSGFIKLKLLCTRFPNTALFHLSFFTEQEINDLTQSGLWYRSGTCLKPSPTNDHYYEVYLKFNLIDAIF
jgi:hypothetical protein